MICSFSRRFLFVKTRKTGGTSVEIALSRYCARGDIITPISPVDELMRLDSGRLAQNYLREHRYRELAYRLAIRLRRQRIAKTLTKLDAPFYNHMSLAQIRELIEPRRLEGLTTFTIERHPYEKVMSLAYFSRKTKANRDREIGDIVDTVIEQKKYLNYPLYTLGGKLAVDTVIQYDELMPELNAILAKLSLAPLSTLPNAKGGFRTERKPAAEVLSERQKQRIQADAAFEFEQFGYAR